MIRGAIAQIPRTLDYVKGHYRVNRPAPAISARRFELVARYCTVGLIALAAGQATYAARGLYADGAYHMWRILESQSFYPYPSRATTEIVTQLPVIAASHFGVKDVAVLVRLWSFGSAGVPMILWAIALLVLLRHRLFWPFVAIFAVTFLNSGFFSVGEYNFASAVVALSAAILLRGCLKPWTCLALVLCAMLLPLSYQTLAWLGPLLAALALVRLRAIGPRWRTEPGYVAALVIAVLMYLVAAVLNIWWTVAPPPIIAPVTLAQWVWPIFNDRQLELSGAIATLYLGAWGFGGVRVHRAAVVMLVGASLLLLDPSLWNAPWMQYASRGVTGVALFVLIGILALGDARRQHRAIARADSKSRGKPLPGLYWLVGASLFFVQMVPFAMHTQGWSEWLSSFDRSVTTSHGILTNTATVLKFRDTSHYVWPWTNPILSVVLHTRNGQAIILSPGQALSKHLSLPAALPKGFHMDGLFFGGRP